MFCGHCRHCNKSIHHCSVVQQGFGCANREVVSFLPGISPRDVDGSEGSVERKGLRLLVSGLAVCETRELLRIAEELMRSFS